MNIFLFSLCHRIDKKKSVHIRVFRGPTKHPPREMPNTHDASHLLLPEKARIKHCKWLIYRGGVAAKPTLIPNALQQCASSGERYVAVRSVMICEEWKVIYPLSRSSAFVALVAPRYSHRFSWSLTMARLLFAKINNSFELWMMCVILFQRLSKNLWQEYGKCLANENTP